MGMSAPRILVTGAASGIGAALAQQLASAGAAVLGLDRAGTDIICDLADPAAIAAAAAGIDGPLHGIAHVAGLPGTAPPERILAVNLAGPVLLNQLLEPRLAPGAAIVAVASITAQRCNWADADLAALVAGGFGAVAGAAAGIDGTSAYQLSKKALICWVMLATGRLRHCRINAVSPGPVETPILADFEASIGKDRIAAAAALAGRHASATEIAAIIAWLLGPDAAWINGADIRADGGYTARRMAAAMAAPGLTG
jgi:NAD(P)-dependent dehydrogenase (short-subunit alcohol dehydrogenase family)